MRDSGSGKGPVWTDVLPRSIAGARVALARKPSPRHRADSTSSSLKRVIAARSCSVGIAPASTSAFDFTSPRTA